MITEYRDSSCWPLVSFEEDIIDKLKYNSPYERVTQTVLVPLRDFLETTPSLEISRVKQVRLRFDRIPEGEIILSELGIGGF